MSNLKLLNATDAASLNKGDSLVWKHKDYDSLKGTTKEENILKEVVVESVYPDLIRTEVGHFTTKNGKKDKKACGCDRFCSCYGRVYVQKS